MVERSRYGVVEDKGGACFKCGELTNFIHVVSKVNGDKRFCSFECQLRHEGFEIEDDGIEKLLQKKLKEYQARVVERDGTKTANGVHREGCDSHTVH